jgi:hypothetical protein
MVRPSLWCSSTGGGRPAGCDGKLPGTDPLCPARPRKGPMAVSERDHSGVLAEIGHSPMQNRSVRKIPVLSCGYGLGYNYTRCSYRHRRIPVFGDGYRADKRERAPFGDHQGLGHSPISAVEFPSAANQVAAGCRFTRSYPGRVHSTAMRRRTLLKKPGDQFTIRSSDLAAAFDWVSMR